MKIIRYIYALLIAVILGFFSFACSDDDEQTEEKGAVEKKEDTKQPITTTIKVCVETPDVSGDIDVSTRAGDNANIEYALPENGGRFQNIIIVVTDESDKIYAIHCNKWYTGTDPSSTGVKQYEWIFPDLKIGSGEGSKARVYAVGNVTTGYYETISGYTIADSEKGKKSFSDFEILKKLFGTSATISVSDAYKLKFKPKDGNFIVSGTQINKTRCTGMPVNARIEKDINKGATVFSVHMKRVAARLQITFSNFTGTYIDYDSNEAKDNNIYIDQFEIPGILRTDSQFGEWNSSPSGRNTTTFQLSEFIRNNSVKDEVGNPIDADGNVIDIKHVKIKNGDKLTISLYVLETTMQNAYTYNLKLDRGKSLGLNTTKIEADNAYVIWNNTNHNSLAYKGGKVCASRAQDSYDKIPFSDQVFWTIQSAPGAKVSNTYVIQHCTYNDITDYATSENIFLKQQNDPTDWGVHYHCNTHNTTFTNGWDLIIHYISKFFKCSISNQLVDEKFTHTFVDDPSTSKGNDAQYVNFVLDPTSTDQESRFTLNLLKSSQKKQNKNYWESQSKNGQTYYNYLFLADENNTLCCSRGAAFNTTGVLNNYDWTLYAKYILRNNNTVDSNGNRNNYLKFKQNGVVSSVTEIERNGSYEIDFSVLPNEVTKQEFLVNCVRTQNEIDWEETEK